MSITSIEEKRRILNLLFKERDDLHKEQQRLVSATVYNDTATRHNSERIRALQKELGECIPSFAKQQDDPLTRPIGILGLSEATLTVLMDAKIFTIGQLIDQRDEDVFALPNSSRLKEEINRVLTDHCLPPLSLGKTGDHLQ